MPYLVVVRAGTPGLQYPEPMPALTIAAAVALMSPKSEFEARAKDWTLGPVVYQVFVDRFAPPANLDAKASLYEAPKKLHTWDEVPKAGTYDEKIGYWTHELDFWGGDLPGVTSKLDYVQSLGSEVLYLTPIFKAYSNHKYDTTDYFSIAPEFGTAEDFNHLKDATHKAGMKLMLDGVFNHVGRKSDLFLGALQNANDPHRDWFFFGDQYKNGYRSFAAVANLPAWKVENSKVRDYLWNGKDSVVRHWLKKGADGWRLDVAFELGPEYLGELTSAAHKQKQGSPVVGEIAGYPSEWFPAVDGVFNFFPIDLGKNMLAGAIEGGKVGQMLDDMVADAPYENLLKSWILTDNHDTPRLATQFPDIENRRVLEAMQFTLPGSPVIYYGTELGMEGGGDPACRAPMRWDLVTTENKDLAWVKQLVALRKSNPALRYGDFKALRTTKLLAYLRTTDKLRQSVMVVVNPSTEPVTETFAVRIGQLMSWGEMKDALSGDSVRAIAGQATVTMKPKSVRIFNVVDDATSMGYSQYSRIK